MNVRVLPAQSGLTVRDVQTDLAVCCLSALSRTYQAHGAPQNLFGIISSKVLRGYAEWSLWALNFAYFPNEHSTHVRMLPSKRGWLMLICY